MALTATLALDITAFQGGLRNATASLDGFAQRTVKNTSRDLARMLEGFTGQKVIAESERMVEAVTRIGGASRLTESEQRRVNATVTEALQKYKALGQEAPKALQDLAKATSQAEQPLISMSGILQGVVAGAAAAVTAQLLNAGRAFASFAAEAAARGSQMAALWKGFENLAGGVERATATFEAMRRGSFGLVADLELIQAGNKAMLLGLGLSAEQMGELARTAVVLGRAMGQDAAKSLDDLTTALGRSSPMILDNLGLSVKVGEANEKYAAALGIAASALSDAEKKQAFMNAAMDAARIKVAELGDVQLTASEAGTKLWTAITNLADSMADLTLNNSVVVGEVNRLVDGMNTLELVIRHGPIDAIREWKKEFMGAIPVAKDYEAVHQSLQPTVAAVALSETDLFKALEGTTKEMERATERVKEHEAAVKGIGVVWGTQSFIVHYQIAGVLHDSLVEFETDTGNAAEAMAELADEIARARGEAIKFDNFLVNKFTPDFTAGFAKPVEENKPKIKSFFKDVFGSAEEFGIGVSGIFQAAFEGGGGALGAVKSFATQAMSNLLGMIPGIGPFVQAFAGPIIEMFSKLIGKAKEFFRVLFGGPSQGELNDRNLVKDFEDQVIGALTAQQEAEAGGERWKQVVIAVRDAYLAAGLSAEEAERDVARLWESSREGGEESWRVVDEINRKMQGAGAAAAAAVDEVTDAISRVPRNVDIEFRTSRTGDGEEGGGGDAGYATGTMGRHGRWFQRFGAGKTTRVHGEEAIITPAQAPAFAADVMAASVGPVNRMGGGGAMTITVPVTLDGYQIAMATVPHVPAALKRRGVV